MCCGLEYYKEQDGTFFLALPLREICCWMFSLRAECGIPQCFSRKLPEKNNHTSSVICWHEGQEHTNCLDLASCLLFRNQTAGITDSLPETPWDILDYSSTIKISLYGVLLCFLKAHFSSLCIPETKGIRKSMDRSVYFSILLKFIFLIPIHIKLWRTDLFLALCSLYIFCIHFFQYVKYT